MQSDPGSRKKSRPDVSRMVMPAKLASRSLLGRLFAWFTLRRALAYTGMFFYCLALFLAFDFAYSSLTRGEEKARGADRKSVV